jgi:methylenetetrahydrofolate reductase (NADPH)
LKEKVDAGADFILTQLFFDNADYFEFRDFVAGKLGVSVPLVPGIVPILSAPGIIKFTQTCGAKIPPPLRAKLDELGTNDEAAAEFGIEYATRQCEELVARRRAGAAFLHAEQIALHRPGFEKSGAGVTVFDLRHANLRDV